jgi:hypothetical protein
LEALDPDWAYVPKHIQEAAREILGEPQANLADHNELTTALTSRQHGRCWLIAKASSISRWRVP